MLDKLGRILTGLQFALSGFFSYAQVQRQHVKAHKEIHLFQYNNWNSKYIIGTGISIWSLQEYLYFGASFVYI